MQSYNINETSQTKEDKEKIVGKYLEIFQAMDRSKAKLETINSNLGSIPMMLAEMPDFDIMDLRTSIEIVKQKLNATETEMAKKPVDILALIKAGEELISAEGKLISEENDRVNTWSIQRSFPRRSVAEENSLIADLKKSHPELYAVYEAELTKSGPENIARARHGCPPLNIKALPDKFYPNLGKPECAAGATFTPKLLGNNTSNFDAVFLMKVIGGSIFVAACTVVVSRNYQRLANTGSSIIAGIKSGLTKFKGGPAPETFKYSNLRDAEEKTQRRNP